jgi:hypothetical protein
MTVLRAGILLKAFKVMSQGFISPGTNGRQRTAVKLAVGFHQEVMGHYQAGEADNIQRLMPHNAVDFDAEKQNLMVEVAKAMDLFI